MKMAFIRWNRNQKLIFFALKGRRENELLKRTLNIADYNHSHMRT